MIKEMFDILKNEYHDKIFIDLCIEKEKYLLLQDRKEKINKFIFLLTKMDDYLKKYESNLLPTFRNVIIDDLRILHDIDILDEMDKNKKEIEAKRQERNNKFNFNRNKYIIKNK